jgi:hypothetical protein
MGMPEGWILGKNRESLAIADLGLDVQLPINLATELLRYSENTLNGKIDRMMREDDIDPRGWVSKIFNFS